MSEKRPNDALTETEETTLPDDESAVLPTDPSMVPENDFPTDDARLINDSDDEPNDDVMDEVTDDDEPYGDETGTDPDDNPDTDIVPDIQEPDVSDASVKRRSRIRAPLVIAAILLLVTALFFGVWMCFFNQTIIGSWSFTHNTPESEFHTTFTFHEDRVDFYLGGTTYTGKYFLSKSTNDKNIVQIILTRCGTQVLDTKFYYEVSGNLFTGRTLTMTDLEGFLLPPDNLDTKNEEALAEKQKIASRYTEENDTRFYVFDFQTTNPPSPIVKKIENATQDKQLLGIWYEENELSGYGDTFTFHDDGTYDIIYEDIRYTGCYSAKDGSCTYNLSDNYGGVNEQTFQYKVEGDTLKLDFGSFQSTLKKTNNPYAFKKDIK